MTGFFSYLLGHAHSWGAKLIYIAILFALWMWVFAPVAEQAKILMLWWLNRTVFQILSYNAMVTISNFVVFFATWRVVHWILPHKGHSNHQQHVH